MSGRWFTTRIHRHIPHALMPRMHQIGQGRVDPGEIERAHPRVDDMAGPPSECAVRHATDHQGDAPRGLPRR